MTHSIHTNPRLRIVHLFLQSCTFAVSGLDTKIDDIYEAYASWCSQSTIKSLKKQEFMENLVRFCKIDDDGKAKRLEIKDESLWEFTMPEEVRHIYLITDGTAVKIGLSQDPEARLKELQTGNPRKLHIFGTIVGDYDKEKLLQEHFASKNLGGEWFALGYEEAMSILKGEI
jgi:hypothetical protein